MKISDAMVEAFEVAYELAWDTRAGIAAALKVGGFQEETRPILRGEWYGGHESRLVGLWEQKT